VHTGVTTPSGPSAAPAPPPSPPASGAGGRATRRDHQKRATREALRSAALRLFGEQGFQETTVDDIAAAVGVSKRTFFLHFASKDEVLLGHVAQQLEVLRGELAAMPGELGIFERAGHAVAALAEDMQRRDDLLLQLDLVHRAPQLLAVNLEQFTAFEDAIADAVRRWLRAGAPRRLTREQDGYAQLVGTVSIAALRAALTVWRRRGGRGSLGALVAKQVGTLRAGMSSP
jgi:TetR/AcrR family transcriptional regulator, regulator of mycofactocin system